MNTVDHIVKVAPGVLATITAASFNHVAAGICALVTAGYYLAKWIRESREGHRK